MGKKYNLCFGISQDHDASDSKAGFSVTYVAVVCDKKGRIVDCVFDAVENTVMLDGGVVNADEAVFSKNELGLEYSMKSASAIGREWYEQAAHFADFIKGKRIDSIEEVDGGEAELMAGCTININGFKEAIDDASEEENMMEFAASAIPSVSVAIAANHDGSKNASSERDGIAALNITYAAVAQSGGKISASILEQTETNVYFDHSGLIINLDKSDGKRDMGYDYGMKSASELGLEWFEQADNFGKYIIGMTPNEVADMRLNGAFAADDVLLAGCTIKVDDFVKAVSKTGK